MLDSDIVIIKNHLANYCHTVDRETAQDVAMLFQHDATLVPAYDGDYRCSGREKIKQWYDFYQKNMKNTVTNLRHFIHSEHVVVTGSKARSICYFTGHFISNADKRAYQAVGSYHDCLQKEDNVWLFSERRIEVDFLISSNEVIKEMVPLGYTDS